MFENIKERIMIKKAKRKIENFIVLNMLEIITESETYVDTFKKLVNVVSNTDSIKEIQDSIVDVIAEKAHEESNNEMYIKMSDENQKLRKENAELKTENEKLTIQAVNNGIGE